MKLKYLAGIFLLTMAQGATIAKINFGDPTYTAAGWDNQFTQATSFPSYSKTISWSDSGSFTLTLSATGTSGTAGTGAAWNGGIPDGIAGDEAKGSIYTRTGNITLTFTGLTAGIYDLSLLAARGNGDMANTQFVLDGSSESLDGVSWDTYRGTGASWGSATSSLGDTSSTITGGANGSALGMYTQASNILVGEDGTLTLTIKNMGGGYNNVALNFLTLERTGDLPIPEPSTAMLGLLALAGTMVKRRR